MTQEEQKKKVEEILGSPLPDLDPIYIEGAKVYMKMSPNTFITPYLMSEVYTKEEMQMVSLLPSTAPEIAKKLGLDVDYVDSALTDMELLGKIIASNVANPRIFSPHLNMVAFRDSIGNGRIARERSVSSRRFIASSMVGTYTLFFLAKNSACRLNEKQ